jgi:DNA-binding transcriptional LysR family regulator
MKSTKDNSGLVGGFSLERLESLLNVSDSEYIAKAAGHNTVRASLISRQITDLEGHFGVPLKKKDGRLAKLNKHGEALAKITRLFIDSLDDFRNRVNDLPPQIIIGAGQSLFDTILLPKLGGIRNELKSARFSLKSSRSAELIECIKSGKMDLAILSGNRIKDQKFEKKILRTIKYRLYVPRRFESEINGRNYLDTIFNLPFATLDGVGELRSAINDLGLKKKKRIKLELECSSLNQVACAIKCGEYCGILPDSYEEHFEPQILSYSFPSLSKLDRKIYLVWSRSTLKYKPNISHVVDAIAKAF